MGGTTPSRTKPEYWGGDIPWVVPSELSDLPGRYLTATKECITEWGRKAAGLRVIPPGSVLLTSRATIGSTAITTTPVVTNQGFQNLVARNGTHGLWLFYCISAQTTNLERRASGSTFREVSRGSVRSLPIVIPPLPEQRAIAAVLDSMDETIERTEAVIAATEQLRDAIRHELLTCGIPGWHSNWNRTPRFGVIPANWKVVRLDEIAHVIGGSTPSRAQEQYWNGDVPWVVPSELSALSGRFLTSTRESITEVGMQAAGLRVIPAGSVLLTSRATIGAVAINTVPVVTNQGFKNLVARRGTHSLWLFYCISAMRQELERRASGSTFREISGADVRALPICFPSFREQEAIARTLDSVDNAIDAWRRKRDALNQIKASTAEALLTGQRRMAVEAGRSR